MALGFSVHSLRNFVEDVVSRGISGLPASLLSTAFEGWVYSSDYVVWGKTRFFYAILFPVNVFIWSKLLDKMRVKYTSMSQSVFRKFLADGLALAMSIVPVYTLCAVMAGASILQIGIMIVWSTVLGFFAGRINDLARDLLRKYSQALWKTRSVEPS